jgi:signal transduction histidine kinase
MADNSIIFTVVFSTLIILLLIAGVAIVIFVASKQRTAQEMRMAQMKLDYEKEFRVVQHEVQEQVLINISRELHDNIGQMLTVMHLQLEQKKLMSPDMSPALQAVHDTLSQVTQQVRFLSKGLNSDVLEQNGLLATMQTEITRLQQINHFAIHWVNDGTEPVLNKDQRLMSFRIFQEILNNVIKHAHARNLYVTLAGKDGFKMIIQDDGKGFNAAEKLKEGKGSGLRNIYKRVTLANLFCDITAEEGKGSTFTLSETNSKP